MSIIARIRQRFAKPPQPTFSYPGKETGQPVPLRIMCDWCGDPLAADRYDHLFMAWVMHSNTHVPWRAR